MPPSSPQRSIPQVRLPDSQVIRQIISRDDPEALVKCAEQIGEAIAQEKVTTSQIRNVFGTVRQIQLRWPKECEDEAARAAYRDAVLLRPKLGYHAKRVRGMNHLERTLVPALEEVSLGASLEEQRVRFNRFVDFFEAIVAYHKKYGGRDN